MGNQLPHTILYTVLQGVERCLNHKIIMDTLQNYKFYSKQHEHIAQCAYSNPKIRVKCFTRLKEDIEEYMEMNSTKIKATYNATKRFKSLLTMINKNIKANQTIIDWNEAQA